MKCKDCDGSGTFKRPATTVDGIAYPALEQECETCNGLGWMCDRCNGNADRCICDDEWEGIEGAAK